MNYYTRESFIKKFGEYAWELFVDDRTCPQCDISNEMEEEYDEIIDEERYTVFTCDSDSECLDFAVRTSDLDD